MTGGHNLVVRGVLVIKARALCARIDCLKLFQNFVCHRGSTTCGQDREYLHTYLFCLFVVRCLAGGGGCCGGGNLDWLQLIDCESRRGLVIGRLQHATRLPTSCVCVFNSRQLIKMYYGT